MNASNVRPLTDADKAALLALDSLPADPAILQAKFITLREQYLYLAADFENFRKRARRDAGQQAAVEKEAFILELLPVIDNFERAIAAEPSHQGVAMVLRQLGQLLSRHGIEAVEAVGRPFDPHRHEAVLTRHDAAHPDQVVLEVLQCGYRRRDDAFCPAKVVVNSHIREDDDVC